jgi:hypothetical protein
MPYLVVCPNCAMKLKSATPIAAGRTLNCPQCKGQFTLSEPAVALDGTGHPVGGRPAAPGAPAPEAPKTARAPVPGRLVPAPPPPPPRKSSVQDLPAAEFVDDEDHRPKPRRRNDDEDDRPRSRRRDSDDGDRPLSRRGPRDEDDEDDRPRRRRGRDEDEDEEDRPAGRRARGVDAEDDEEVPPRARKQKKKGNKALLIALVAGTVAVLLCGGGGALLYFLDPFGLFGGASSDMLAWMPADTQMIEGMDAAEVAKSPKALAAVRQDVRDVESLGIKLEDMSFVMQGKKGKQGTAEVTVVRLKAAAQKDQIAKAAGGTEATANGKQYFKTRSGGAIYFPSNKMLVLARSEYGLTGLLQKEEGKVVISEDLRAVVKRADGQLWAAAVGPDAGMFGGGAGAFGAPGVGAPPAPKSMLMAAKLAGDEANIKMELTFADAETAKKAAEQIESMFKMLRDMIAGMEKMVGGNPGMSKVQDAQKMFGTMKVTTSGSTVIITMTGPIDSFGSMGKGGGFGK